MKDVIERWVRFDGLFGNQLGGGERLYRGMASLWPTHIIECTVRRDVFDDDVGELLLGCVGMGIEDSLALLVRPDGHDSIKSRSITVSFVTERIEQ